MSDVTVLLEQLVHFWERHNLRKGERIVVGVSGGIDSQVLLHALLSLRQELELELHVATLDHNLRGLHGAADADFVEQLAQHWQVPVTRATVDVQRYIDDYALNMEEAARQARYTFLLEVANTVDASYIAVGHNHDDQAETVLMHLIRGTGLQGLRGMLPVAPLSEYHLLDFELDEDYDYLPEDFELIRPLLDIPRIDIKAYAAEVGIVSREDASNDDLTRFRNTLRHDILPRLRELNPNIDQTLSRLANVVQAEVEVLNSQLDGVAAWLLEWEETEPTPDEEDGGEVVFIDRASFRSQPLALQRALIRKAVFELSPTTRDMSFDQTEAVRDMILNGSTNSHLDLPDGLYLDVGYDDAMLGYGGAPFYPPHLPSLRPGEEFAIDMDGQGYINAAQRLITYWVVEGLSKDWHPADPLECTLAIPEDANIILRTRRAGDRFRPFGLDGKSQKLSDTFTNLKVPSYYRDQVPLLLVNDEIAWFVVPTAQGPVGRIADRFAVRPADAEKSSILRVRWQINAEPIEG